MDADLIFPESYKSDGFTNNVTSSQAAAPDPVVRELLQNSLDAAIREAGRERAEVHFTIVRRPVAALPGLDAYHRAFKAAVAQREAKAGSRTHDERAVIERIQGVLSQTEMSVLFCRDNGIGLDHSRMEALLTEGNSDKPMVGAGSYGLGHLTAFAASDLHYVLYAGRRRSPGGGDISSGRTILAAHKVKQTQHAAEGFWRLPVDVFNLDDSNYPSVVPSLLRDEIERVDGNGSVVAIAGFNHFHDDDAASAFDDICRVAALNFLAAIWTGRMVVYVHDEFSGREECLDADSLARLLRDHRGQQRLPVGMRGWLVGSQGWRALETLSNGRKLDIDIDRSVQVYFRALDDGSNERSRVQLFRDGMWIDNDAPELGTGAFNGVQPFDAVVLLHDADPDDHGEVYDLVRNAEGPEHRGLTKFRALPKHERDRLREMLKQLADRLREEAGAIEHEESYTPTGFAVFNADDLRDATPVPRLRHRPSGGYQTGTDETGGVAEDPPTPNEAGRGIPSEPHQRRAPAPGKAVRVKSSIVPVDSANGEVQRFAATLEIAEEGAARDRYELRVLVESGSDESCDQPIQPQWLSIRSATVDGDVIDAGGKLEVAIPKTARSLTIDLAEAVPVGAVLELDVVRRRGSRGTG